MKRCNLRKTGWLGSLAVIVPSEPFLFISILIIFLILVVLTSRDAVRKILFSHFRVVLAFCCLVFLTKSLKIAFTNPLRREML